MLLLQKKASNVWNVCVGQSDCKCESYEGRGVRTGVLLPSKSEKPHYKRAETPKERYFREDYAKTSVSNKKQKTIEQVIEESQRVDVTKTDDSRNAVGAGT